MLAAMGWFRVPTKMKTAIQHNAEQVGHSKLKPRQLKNFDALMRWLTEKPALKTKHIKPRQWERKKKVRKGDAPNEARQL